MVPPINTTRLLAVSFDLTSYLLYSCLRINHQMDRTYAVESIYSVSIPGRISQTMKFVFTAFCLKLNKQKDQGAAPTVCGRLVDR